MIMLWIRMKVAESTRDKVLDTLKAILEPTRAEEGCLSMELFESLEESGGILLSQRWSDKTSLTIHMRGRRWRSLLIATDLLDKPPEFTLAYIPHELEVQDIHDLMKLFGGPDHTGGESK
jgi:quinol monooxygenase YgiN